MSIAFWIRRKKRAAMLREKAVGNPSPVVEKPSVTVPVEEAKKPVKRAVKKTDDESAN